MNKLILHSYAKLNLYLEILHRRPDHYHALRTIFERINLADTIVLQLRQDKKIKIICQAPDVPRGSANLAFKSARLLQESLRINKGVQIEIKKSIPVSAGLGGGSSNAATVLSGLNILWKLRLSRSKLVALARKIGSDVPFFLYDSSFALGEGRGDRIKPLDLQRVRCLWHVLVVPKIKVQTVQIYQAWDRLTLKRRSLRLTNLKSNAKMIISVLKKNDCSLPCGGLFNRLEDITLGMYPQVARIKEKLKDLGLKSILMSGSGPAIFGIVSSKKEAQALGRQLQSENRSWRVFVTRTI